MKYALSVLVACFFVSGPLASADSHATKPEHKEHKEHTHKHGKKCGHKEVAHGDHTDYDHDGHKHVSHESHVDECAGTTTEPKKG